MDGRPANYPATFAAAVRVSMTRLAEEDAEAVRLLRICAVLAPEPVPVAVLCADRARPLLEFRRSLGRIGRYGLARITQAGPQLHRLTQAVIAAPRDEARDDEAARLLVAAAPGDSRQPETWPEWRLLLPHLLVFGPASGSAALRPVLLEAVWYLFERGDIRAAEVLARRLHDDWTACLGPDHPDTLGASYDVASACRRMGRYDEALTLARAGHLVSARALGPDHDRTLHFADQTASCLRHLARHAEAHTVRADTLSRARATQEENSRFALGVAHNLAVDLRLLGQTEDAVRLNADTFERRRAVLGDDHPHTMVSATDVARDLRTSGRLEEASRMCADNLARARRVLGSDHPATLDSAHDAAVLEHLLGRVAESAALLEDTLTRRAEVLGPDHPSTLESRAALAQCLGD